MKTCMKLFEMNEISEYIVWHLYCDNEDLLYMSYYIDLEIT